LAVQQEEVAAITIPVPAEGVERIESNVGAVVNHREEPSRSIGITCWPKRSDDDDDDDEDPAERLSALLEQVSPSIAAADETRLMLDLASTNGESEAKPRMAWPTPGAGGQSG
jgi:hypothetical protein